MTDSDNDGGHDGKPDDLAVYKGDQRKIRLREMLDSIEELREIQEIVAEYNTVLASMKHKKFVSLIDAGFTESQAIEIVCRVPIVET